KDRIVDALRGVASVRGYEGVDFRDMRRQRELGDEEVRLAQDKMGDRESLGANFAAKEVLSENQHGRNLELENFRQGGVDPVSQYIAELMGKDFLGEQDFQRDAALAGLKNSAQLSPEALFAAIAERYPEIFGADELSNRLGGVSVDERALQNIGKSRGGGIDAKTMLAMQLLQNGGLRGMGGGNSRPVINQLPE